MKIQNNFNATFEGNQVNVLSTDNRHVLSKESMMNKANLSTYSKNLKEKNCIVSNGEGGYKVNPILMPNTTGGIIEYTFTLDVED